MEPRRIFGTKYLAHFNGTVTDVFGNEQPTRTPAGKHTQVRLGNRWLSLSKLIAEAFIGRSNKAIVHIDGNKRNNAAFNLMYTSRTSIMFGAHHGAYRALKRDVIDGILEMVDNEDSLEDICTKFKVRQELVILVIKRRNENN